MADEPLPQVAQTEYETRVLAYIDILGWSELVQRSAKEPAVMALIGRAIQRMKVAKARNDAITEAAQKDGWNSDLDVRFTLFSDTVVLSSPDVNPFALTVLFTQIQVFCTELMSGGIYTRGAIVVGRILHQHDVIYGPALVDAYKQEREVAKYPRILVDDQIYGQVLVADAMGRRLGAEKQKAPVASGMHADRILRDHDGLLFLNWFAMFSSDLSSYRPLVEGAVVRAKEERDAKMADLGIRAKLGWLVGWLNDLLDAAKSADTTSRALAQPL